MSSIAYITDSKLLELHRLNQNKEMNFWRLNTNNKFTNFKIGDLLFFLSKDKEHMHKREKGIVGYGRCQDFETCSINTMWKRYGELNGYRNKNSFIEAVSKVSKDHKIPSKISSIYLKDIVFFQSPIYLSECGMKISNRVESFVYLDETMNTTFNILDKAKGAEDIWTSNENIHSSTIEHEQIRNALYLVHDKIAIKDLKNKSKSYQDLKKYVLPSDGFKIIKDSKYEGYHIHQNILTIVFAPLFISDKIEEYRILIGQANMYKQLIPNYYPYDIDIKFVTSNHNKELEDMLNK